MFESSVTRRGRAADRLYYRLNVIAHFSGTGFSAMGVCMWRAFRKKSGVQRNCCNNFVSEITVRVKINDEKI